MADDTTSQAPAAASAQQRERADPTERSQPIPLLAALVTVAALLFGVGYFIFAEAPGAPALGDRRTLDDLRRVAADATRQAGAADGKQVFAAQCVACHQANGQGLPGVFPPLAGSEWVVGDERILAHILLHGIVGEISVAGVAYKGNMPGFKQLSDAELAAVASHVRSAWSNKAAPIKAELFAQERKAGSRTTPYAGGAELKTLGTKAP
jgi:mono/diheme cytochrome c family protein